METLIYFTLFAGLFFLTMRFGCGAHVKYDGKGIETRTLEYHDG